MSTSLVKLTKTGKVSLKMSAAVLDDFLVALELYFDRFHGVPLRKTEIVYVVLKQMWVRKFASSLIPVGTTSIHLSEALALLDVWKRYPEFSESNMLSALLMQVEQKLG